MKLNYLVRHGNLGVGDTVSLDKSGLSLAKEIGMQIAPMYSTNDLIEGIRELPNVFNDDGTYVEEHEEYHCNYMINKIKEVNECGKYFKLLQKS